MKRVRIDDPEGLAERLRAWLDHGSGDIVAIGAEFTRLTNRANRMVRRGQHDEAAQQLARDLRSALDPILNAEPWVCDLLMLLNRRAPEDAKIAAADRLLDLLAAGAPCGAIAALLEALAIAHEATGVRQQVPALRLGLASDAFRRWLRNRLAAQQAVYWSDQEPTTRRKVFGEKAAGTRKVDGLWRQLPGEAAGATPADLALASAVIHAPRERELARLLATGATLEEAAAAMQIAEPTVRVLLGRLHRRAG